MSAFQLLLARHEAQPTCNLAWIGKQLGFGSGRAKWSEASLEAYVSRLICERGFPRPFPHLKHGGGLSDDVSYTRSEWLRVGVEHWLGDYLPPVAAASVEEEAELAAAEEMDRAAQQLQIVGGTATRQEAG